VIGALIIFFALAGLVCVAGGLGWIDVDSRPAAWSWAVAFELAAGGLLALGLAG